jgi:hypothetical protein
MVSVFVNDLRGEQAHVLTMVSVFVNDLPGSGARGCLFHPKLDLFVCIDLQTCSL